VLLNKQNVNHPRELYGYLLDQGFKHLQFIPCVERNTTNKGLAHYSITPDQYGQFLSEVFDEWMKEGVPQVYIRDFEDVLISYMTGETPSCLFSKKCGKYVVAEYNGDVYPCDFFVEPQWFLGNLMEKPLEEIIASEKFLKFKNRKTELALKCKECPWLQYCHGGCPRHWNVSGSERNYFCSSYRTFFEYADQGFLRLKRYVKQEKLKD
jgi:uncharacterized protein